MNEQAIVERIISDAESEAEAIIKDAEARAAETVARANERAERMKKGTEAEVAEKSKGIFDGKAATARLDCAKIMLAEKRGVIDEIYRRALEQLIGLGEKETVVLANRLLEEYAEEGDEIIFAENFRYNQAVSKLSIIKERKLKVSAKTASLDGGFMLSGKVSDKNLSYGALLSADRDSRQAEIAAEIFSNQVING